jgi:Tfp pilus assembly protein PilO
VGVAIVVVLALLFFFMIRPRQGELGDLRTQVETEENTTTALQLELQRLQALQENEAELEATLAAIRELVPRNNQVPNFIFQTQDAADEAGVDFVSITPELPKTPPEGAALAEVRIAINAGGGFFSIQDFMRRLYELDRALRIDLVSMTGQADTETGEVEVNLDITARVFFELPAGGTNPAPGGTPTDTSTPAPVDSPTPGADGTSSPPPAS